MREAGAADVYRLIVIAGAAAFFSELRKSNRRRVRLDPASQFDNSCVFGHRRVIACERPYGAGTATVMDWLATANVRASSVIFRVTTYEPARSYV